MRSPAAPLIAWSRVFMASPPQIGEARRFLAAIVDGLPCADDALLCLSEVATNAMLHSRSRQPGGCFTVRAQRYGNHLRVEVCDQGGPWLPPSPAAADRQSGRGLVIVEQVARAWGRRGDEAGWTVWFEMGARPCPVLDHHPGRPVSRPSHIATMLTREIRVITAQTGT